MSSKYDWERDGVKHIEFEGGIVNIREGLSNSEGNVTHIEIIPDECPHNGKPWKLDGNVNTRLIQEV